MIPPQQVQEIIDAGSLKQKEALIRYCCEIGVANDRTKLTLVGAGLVAGLFGAIYTAAQIVSGAESILNIGIAEGVAFLGALALIVVLVTWGKILLSSVNRVSDELVKLMLQYFS